MSVAVLSSPNSSSPAAASARSIRPMHANLLDEASKIITDPLVLVNVVSKRVRQMSKGQRPMVEVGVRADLCDIALREIIEGKLVPRAASDVKEE